MKKITLNKKVIVIGLATLATAAAGAATWVALKVNGTPSIEGEIVVEDDVEDDVEETKEEVVEEA